MNRIIVAFAILTLLITSCKEEICLTCNTYNITEFQGDLNTFYDSFIVCEHDDMWNHIVWWSECNGCTFPNDFQYIAGGTGSLINLDIYTVGARNIENVDIDDDGILNDLDPDIDGDSVLNVNDVTPFGNEGDVIHDDTVLELLICTEN